MGGATYDLTDWARAEGGGGVYQTWYPDAADLFEVRLWQAATFYWPQIETRRARWFLTHRFMIEERFQHRTSWEMSLRGSYRLGFTLPVNRFTVEPGALYLPMSAEFFTTQSDEQDVFAGKARLTIGLGDIFSKAWSVELLYAWQERRDTIDADAQPDDNIIELRFKSNVRIRDVLKGR